MLPNILLPYLEIKYITNHELRIELFQICSSNNGILGGKLQLEKSETFIFFPLILNTRLAFNPVPAYKSFRCWLSQHVVAPLLNLLFVGKAIKALSNQIERSLA
jgi:hypothetical protein